MAPLGDLIYQGSDTHVIVSPTNTITSTISLDPGQTLSVIVSASGGTLQPTVTLLAPNGSTIATASASAPGQPAVINTGAATAGGKYKIEVSGVSGSVGLYTIQLVLNAAIETETYGNSNDNSITTAQNIDSSSYSLGGGAATRVAVVGTIQGGTSPGDVWVVARGSSSVLRVNSSGAIVQTISGSVLDVGVLSGIELAPDNSFYVAETLPADGPGVSSGELVHFDRFGSLLGTMKLPDDPANIGYFYPFGFTIATDGSFWVPQPNSGNVIHVSPTGSELASYGVGGIPESAVQRTDGLVVVTGFNMTAQAILLDPSTGNFTTYTNTPSTPQLASLAGTSGVWIGDFDNGAERFDYAGNLLQTVGYFGTVGSQYDPSGNIWVSNFDFSTLYRFDTNGNFQFADFVNSPIGLTVVGVDAPNPPPADAVDFYSVTLQAGQSTRSR